MDIWRFYELNHSEHTFCNPVEEADFEALANVLALEPGQRVLDIACGFAEYLIRFVERFGVAGVGVDKWPFALGEAERRRAARVPEAALDLVEREGVEYRSDVPFDVAMSIGASWIWDGFEGTLDALRGHVAPGGRIVVGEPYWISEPPPEYLEAEDMRRDQFGTLADCHARALARGLSLVWMRASSHAAWDRYEMTQSAALDRYARAHPDDETLPEIVTKRRKIDEAYIRWGRDCFGFATWVFRVPPS